MVTVLLEYIDDFNVDVMVTFQVVDTICAVATSKDKQMLPVHIFHFES